MCSGFCCSRMLCLQEWRTCCVSLCPMSFSNFAVLYSGGVSSPIIIASSLLSCLFIVAVFFPATLAGMAGGCSMLSWRLRFVRIIKYLRYVVVLLLLLTCRRTTPSCQLRLKARVDLGDQTAEFIPFEVISTAILMYFYLLSGTNARISVSAINTRFQPDAPGWCRCALCAISRYHTYHRRRSAKRDTAVNTAARRVSTSSFTDVTTIYRYSYFHSISIHE